jgi:hypothetical protein
MTTRSRNVLVLALVLALGAAGAWLLAPTVRERAAVEAVPSGAFLVVTVDLVKLRASPLAHELSNVREVSDVAELCGFDPLSRARSVAIGVPEKPDGVFGVAVNHDLGRDELARCAERVMSARSAMPRVTQRGSWTVLEQEGVLSEATRPKIAYRDGAPVLVARGDYLATMQAALDGQTPRAIDGGEHAALRKRILRRAGSGALLVATALLPKRVRDRIQQEMTDEGDAPASSQKTMSAILSVSAVGLAITARGDTLDAFAELDCESEDACAAVRDFLDRKRKTVAARPAARFIGLAGLLDALRMDARPPGKGRPASLELSLSAPESEIARATKALLAAAFAPPPAPPPSAGASGFSPRR